MKDHPTSRPPPDPDFLRRLGLPRDCSPQDVRDAYLRCVRELHPDRGGNAVEFSRLRADYEQAAAFARLHRRRDAALHSARESVSLSLVPRSGTCSAHVWRQDRFYLSLIAFSVAASCLLLLLIVGNVKVVMTLAGLATGPVILLILFMRMPLSISTLLFVTMWLVTLAVVIGMWQNGTIPEIYEEARTGKVARVIYAILYAPFLFGGATLGWLLSLAHSR